MQDFVACRDSALDFANRKTLLGKMLPAKFRARGLGLLEFCDMQQKQGPPRKEKIVDVRGVYVR